MAEYKVTLSVEKRENGAEHWTQERRVVLGSFEDYEAANYELNAQSVVGGLWIQAREAGISLQSRITEFFAEMEEKVGL